MKNLPLLLGTIGITLLMIIGVAFMFSGDGTTSPDQAVPVAEDVLLPEGAHTKGATESAQVTVVEFSDFECPACKAAQPLVERLMSTYGESVQFVYRHYPLVSIHPNAQPAAIFAEAAADQGKFWEVHDLLFETQSEWSDISDRTELQETFMRYAESLDMDVERLQEKMNDEAVLAVVQRDVSDGNTANISGTPTFYVNGVQTPAPQLLSTVESLVVNIPESGENDSGE